MGVKILHGWKIRVKILQCLKKKGGGGGVNILHPTPKSRGQILHRLKKGGQKGRAYPLPQTYSEYLPRDW